jgi:hypothetical protein
MAFRLEYRLACPSNLFDYPSSSLEGLYFVKFMMSDLLMGFHDQKFQ